MKNQNEFLGGTMSQTMDTPKVFSQLLEKLRPRRIVEIGTFKGGLTVLLGLYGHLHNCVVSTFDNERARTFDTSKVPWDTFLCLGIDYYNWDVFEREHGVAEIITLPGTTLLLCDGGDKPREFNTFAKYLKPGDVIMAHDYSHTVDDYEKNQKKRWRWAHEIMFHHVAGAVKEHGLKPHPMHEEFYREAWLCMVKS